ncbi:phosphoglucosamine mutase [Cytophagaceae bacterium DM2B3-1]|uniref:Phosphoglucosamine mutase n=1 Tax=Xanthocytophaga flava TaxID=3048013 RepID=A0ABT7CZY1_9BACT|nr:phosphoglucosamine mutase [Xanthocytophaga flavus]MDJ1466446.1 phosphoglucosamine mutase [Xanthocytophaga flavus]MDJ1498530.1 phosphoglucosamine mutase [Xanthocytophaga flavus]
MTLITSISGIRGTIGGKSGGSLTPSDVLKYTAAYGTWIKTQASTSNTFKVVIGRDARLSGEMISRIVSSTLQGLGIDIVDVGLSTTPTVEMAVVMEKANGGIIITASHNPIQWNALKLLNEQGEFLSASDGQTIIKLAEENDFTYAEVKKLGKYTTDNTYLQKHIEAILALPLVNRAAIAQRGFNVVIDAVNSSGGIAVPMLLDALGVKKRTLINCDPSGIFAHNPEPLPEHLIQIAAELEKGRYDLGIVVDPDVDRLALICEDGSMFGEEYTLVAVADYILKHHPGGNTVSNLSSTRALRDVTERYGGQHFAAAVGEVNVVTAMKECQSIIGGEGNGGVIYPALHHGRDGLVGIALFLSHLAEFGYSISRLRSTYPDYHISKNKIELTPDIDVDEILEMIKQKYAKNPINTIDGVKIEFGKEWVHLRKSNTEPIIRIYSESDSQSTADYLANKIISDIRELVGQQIRT